MDSITQVVLGAGVGEAVLGKKIGNRAMLWGGIAGTIPDLDVIPGIFMDMVDRMDFHRGFMHSFLFAFLFSPVLALFLKRLYKRFDIPFMLWFWFCLLSVITHPILDTFTTWGTQLFWPLDYRATFNSIFVVDPLYTLPFAALLIWCLRLPKESAKRRKLAYIAVLLSSSYLALSLLAKESMSRYMLAEGKKQGIVTEHWMTKPSPLNIILWYGLLEQNDTCYIAHSSFFDSSDRPLLFNKIPKNKALLDSLSISPKGRAKLDRVLFLTQGFYSVEKSGNCLILSDLRFGLRSFWYEEKEPLYAMFRYELCPQANGDLQVKSLPSKLDNMGQAFSGLWTRMLGGQP